MICTDVYLMKSLITPLKWVLPINAGGPLLYSLALSQFIWGCWQRERSWEEGRGDECAVSKAWHTVHNDGSYAGMEQQSVGPWDSTRWPQEFPACLKCPKWSLPLYPLNIKVSWNNKRRRQICFAEKGKNEGCLLFFNSSLFPLSFLSHLSKQISPEPEQMLQIMD